MVALVQTLALVWPVSMGSEGCYDLSGRIGDSDRWIDIWRGINVRMGYHLVVLFVLYVRATLSFILQLLYYRYKLAS